MKTKSFNIILMITYLWSIKKEKVKGILRSLVKSFDLF